jgi:hypothetical protein
MHHTIKLFLLILFSISTVFLLSAFLTVSHKPFRSHHTTGVTNVDNNSSCYASSEGPVIEWRSGTKLKYSDFKADKKGSPGFAVATTASAFGYRLTDDGGKISGSVFVVFYCDKSWWNPDFILDEVLKHEQLHFDICELFGRKLYQEILTLRRSNRLSIRNINRVYLKLEKQYSNYQDRYDKETDHSTNGQQQLNWNNKIKRQLGAMSKYSNYHKF